ncbi:hypothetical protein D046_6679B, partial [Vibrio parahaemolyticus V-223/04]
ALTLPTRHSRHFRALGCFRPLHACRLPCLAHPLPRPYSVSILAYLHRSQYLLMFCLEPRLAHH